MSSFITFKGVTVRKDRIKWVQRRDRVLVLVFDSGDPYVFVNVTTPEADGFVRQLNEEETA